MKKNYVTMLEMFNNILSFTTSTENKPTTESIGALKQAIETTLTDKVAAIDELVNPQSGQVAGYAAQKKGFKRFAALLCMTVVNSGKAYAKSNNDLVLLGKLKYSYSSLLKINDAAFAEKVNGIIALLTPILTDLQSYGVTQASLDAVTEAAAAFTIFSTQPRQQIVSKKAINELLDGMFSDTNDFVRTIVDPLVFSLRLTNGQYYLGYRAARKHDPHGNKHTHLLANVANELGQPYLGVTVTVDAFTVTDPNTHQSRTYNAIAANTDINGNADVTPFEAGARTVTISGQGIITKTFPAMQFERGKSVSKTFICAPAFNLPAAAPESKTEETKSEVTSSK